MRLMRIAMWSGPRNLSTAMMYSFGARQDFAVVDEPFYAAYLHQTGLHHPGRDEILASQPIDSQIVIKDILGPISGEKPHFYQKHMTQHMLPGIDRGWLADVANVFLIRHPARVIASYAAKRENPTLDDLGFRQQAELFDLVCELGQRPIVIDSADIRQDPEGMLKKLCSALGLPWDPAMLGWPKGGHANDGVWAKHWYGAVHESTGFAGPEGPLPETSNVNAELVTKAMSFYARLAAVKL
jgi:hypothetical protein